MPRYIDVNKIKFSGEIFNDADGDVLVYLSDVRKAIDQTPTADVVEVRHAYWKTVTEIRDNTVCGDGVKIQYRICSNCDAPMGLTGEDYCGCCGAKMDGDGNVNLQGL